MADTEQSFRLEEFRQLHEHIRAFEAAQSTSFTVSLVASTTLLTASSAWFFEMYRTDPTKITLPLCYIFLGPALLSVLTLALMSSYKSAIYRNGYYIKIFFEELGGGARWHIDLVEYRRLAANGHPEFRKVVSAEHGKPAAFIMWTLHAISIGVFVISLFLTNQFAPVHLIAPLPLTFAMASQHRGFASNREKIEEAWRAVRNRVASPGVPQTDARAAPSPRG